MPVSDWLSVVRVKYIQFLKRKLKTVFSWTNAEMLAWMQYFSWTQCGKLNEIFGVLARKQMSLICMYNSIRPGQFSTRPAQNALALVSVSFPHCAHICELWKMHNTRNLILNSKLHKILFAIWSNIHIIWPIIRFIIVPYCKSCLIRISALTGNNAKVDMRLLHGSESMISTKSKEC